MEVEEKVEVKAPAARRQAIPDDPALWLLATCTLGAGDTSRSVRADLEKHPSVRFLSFFGRCFELWVAPGPLLREALVVLGAWCLKGTPGRLATLMLYRDHGQLTEQQVHAVYWRSLVENSQLTLIEWLNTCWSRDHAWRDFQLGVPRAAWLAPVPPGRADIRPTAVEVPDAAPLLDDPELRLLVQLPVPPADVVGMRAWFAGADASAHRVLCGMPTVETPTGLRLQLWVRAADVERGLELARDFCQAYGAATSYLQLAVSHPTKQECLLLAVDAHRATWATLYAPGQPVAARLAKLAPRHADAWDGWELGCPRAALAALHPDLVPAADPESDLMRFLEECWQGMAIKDWPTGPVTGLPLCRQCDSALATWACRLCDRMCWCDGCHLEYKARVVGEWCRFCKKRTGTFKDTQRED